MKLTTAAAAATLLFPAAASSGAVAETLFESQRLTATGEYPEGGKRHRRRGRSAEPHRHPAGSPDRQESDQPDLWRARRKDRLRHAGQWRLRRILPRRTPRPRALPPRRARDLPVAAAGNGCRSRGSALDWDAVCKAGAGG